ncbi:glycosyltransferase family 39 protein [Chloroflexota bacterium]
MVARSRDVKHMATLACALALFILSVATRAIALGSFSWPDEVTWLERSAAFVLAVESGDLPGTYLTDHPGVVPMWGYGTALYLRAEVTGDRTALEALAAESYDGDVPEQLETAALFTVLVTSLTVAASFLLLIPLLGRGGAALGGLLLALDPFYLSHSRVVHVDALLASFMLLSVLSLVIYLKRPERRRYLFLSGAMGGLALLTKTPALFLVPLTALALGIQWLLYRLGRQPRGRIGQLFGSFVLWLATVWGVFLVLFPAAWTRPLFFAYRLFRATRWGVVVSHGSNFLFGRVVDDPGLLFYPVVLGLRLSPVVLLLLLASPILVVVAWKRREDIRLPVIGLAFVLFFTVMVSLAAKKGDRYLLPVFVMADVVVAWVLVALVRAAGRRGQASARIRRIGYGLAAGLVLLSSVFWLRLAPYYGAYFNPLLGGGPTAVRTYAFGQGEGLDLAARYLNDKEDSDRLQVVSFYPAQFRYNFQGLATSLRRGEWDRTWLFADYVVFYVSQVQRQLPTAGLVAFFLDQEPEYVARLGGVDFATVYRSPILLSGQPPAVERHAQDQRLGNELGLTGYALSTDKAAPGDEVYTTLYWQALTQLAENYEFDVRLVDDGGTTIWQQGGPPFEGHFPTSWWPPGRTMYDRYAIPLPRELPPGDLYLVVGARGPDGGAFLAPAGATHPEWPDYLQVTVVGVE